VSTVLKNSLFFHVIVDLNFALLDLVREEIMRALSPVGLALNTNYPCMRQIIFVFQGNPTEMYRYRYMFVQVTRGLAIRKGQHKTAQLSPTHMAVASRKLIGHMHNIQQDRQQAEISIIKWISP
jgi:hypothetical protein